MTRSEIKQAATEYLDRQIATMAKYGEAPKISHQKRSGIIRSLVNSTIVLREKRGLPVTD